MIQDQRVIGELYTESYFSRPSQPIDDSSVQEEVKELTTTFVNRITEMIKMLPTERQSDVAERIHDDIELRIRPLRFVTMDGFPSSTEDEFEKSVAAYRKTWPKQVHTEKKVAVTEDSVARKWNSMESERRGYLMMVSDPSMQNPKYKELLDQISQSNFEDLTQFQKKIVLDIVKI